MKKGKRPDAASMDAPMQKGGLNSGLHAVRDGNAKPVALPLPEGRMSDYKGARRSLYSLPPVKDLLAERGYDANRFREALKRKDITPCIPPRKNSTIPIHYDGLLYKHRHKVEETFAKPGDWRRIAMHCIRCPTPSSAPSASPQHVSSVSFNAP